MSRITHRLRTQLRYLRYNRYVRRALVFGIGGLFVLAAAWLVVTGLLARQQVHKVQASLDRVQTLFASGDLAGARRAAAEIPAEADRANWLTSGPAWWLAAQVPYLGAPFETVRGATSAGVRLGRQGIPELLHVAELMDPAKLRVGGSTLNLSALRTAQPELARASAVLADATRQVDALPHHTWLGAVDGPRQALADELHRLSGYVDAAARAARILPPMLGEKRPQYYFIGMQNEAELRGTGGLPGAFAIARAYHGTVKFVRFGSDVVLEPAVTNRLIKTGLNFGKDYAAAYGDSVPTESFLNSNVSPNFPYAAQIWAKMWERISGQHIAGAIAVDPTVLGLILAVTGPVTVGNGVVVSASNIVSLTQRDEYTLFPDNAQRKAFLVSVLKASAHQLTSGKGSAPNLARVMVAASKAQRLQVWSANSSIEAELAKTSYGAVIGPTDRPLVGPVLNNLSGNKLDYYLGRSLTYHRSGCGADRDVLATLTLTNTAPAFGLPSYVTQREDPGRPADSRPGDYSVLLDYYATKGAQLLSVRVNGERATASLLTVDGQPVIRMPVQLLRGSTVTIELHLQEPAGTGSPKIWKQPGVTPMTVSAYSQPCG